MIRKTLLTGAAQIISAGNQRIARFKITSDKPDRMREVVSQSGLDYAEFLSNPVALRDHNTERVIGTWRNIQKWPDGSTTADLYFASPGISHCVDETWGLVSCDPPVLKSASIGFDVVASEPMDPSRPRGPQRYTKTVLREISVVAIPANADATLLGTETKAHRSGSGRVLVRMRSAAKFLADLAGIRFTDAATASAEKCGRVMRAAEVVMNTPKLTDADRTPAEREARNARIERARRIAAGASPADLDREKLPLVQRAPELARLEAAGAALLRSQESTPAGRQAKAAELAVEPAEHRQNIADARLVRDARRKAGLS